MLDAQDLTNVDQKGIPFTVRSVFIIDPSKKIRLTLQYPASTGRQFNEVLRCIDSLQLGDKNRITTPANWVPGGKVIVHPSVSNDEAEKIFGAGNVEYASESKKRRKRQRSTTDGLHTLCQPEPYLRFTKLGT